MRMAEKERSSPRIKRTRNLMEQFTVFTADSSSALSTPPPPCLLRPILRKGRGKGEKERLLCRMGKGDIIL
jgi:hypothetical protein